MREMHKVVLASAVLLWGLPASTLAQRNTILNGIVTDSTRAVIPGAVVTATNETTGMATTRVTNESGNYEFTRLLPGLYTLTAQVPGFETGIYRNVELRVEEPVLLSFTLELGALETVVVVGTRAQPRSVTESTVPIDAINIQELSSQGVTDLREQLRTIVPSFNVNIQPISDASTIVRPMMLRNLAPDHTLLLVNGKRRHRSSIIDWHGGNGVAFGSQGPDISSIPSIALRQVEVLRDGASAQYGSDAIAGVINLLPKDNRSGGSFEFTTGAYGQGWDGKAYTVAGNVGLPIGETGFANLSLEYGSSNPTDRSIQRSDVAALTAAGNTDIREPAQTWGSPEIDDDLKLFGNFSYLFGNGLQLYGHTNYASKKVTGGFFFRNSNTRGGVFSADGGRTLLIGDMLAARGEGSANCPTVTITNHVPDRSALDQVRADPNCFSFQERFPGGFTPNFGGDATDASVVGAAYAGSSPTASFGTPASASAPTRPTCSSSTRSTLRSAQTPQRTLILGVTGSGRSVSTLMFPMRSTTGSTSRAEPSGGKSSTKPDSASASLGTLVLTLHKASASVPTASAATARLPRGGGTAAASRLTAMSSCLGSKTGGRSVQRRE